MTCRDNENWHNEHGLHFIWVTESFASLLSVGGCLLVTVSADVALLPSVNLPNLNEEPWPDTSCTWDSWFQTSRLRWLSIAHKGLNWVTHAHRGVLLTAVYPKVLCLGPRTLSYILMTYTPVPKCVHQYKYVDDCTLFEICTTNYELWFCELWSMILWVFSSILLAICL